MLGAGAIGGYLGLLLSDAGYAVSLVGRASLVEAATQLRAVTIGGTEIEPGGDLTVTDDPSALDDVDVCLLTVKSGATDAMSPVLAQHLASDALIVSFQNGIQNADRLRTHLSHPIVAGMVGFNVFRDGQATFRNLSKGQLVVGNVDGPGGRTIERLVEAFAKTEQPLEVSTDITGVLAGKLLINLNNGIGAATGLTVNESLRDRDARWSYAACIREGATVMKQARIEPSLALPLPPAALARMLMLPNFVVLTAAKGMVNMDERALTSTLTDIRRGVRTEIDDLNGEIVRLADGAGVPAPINATVTQIVHDVEESGNPPSFLPAADLRRRLEAL